MSISSGALPHELKKEGIDSPRAGYMYTQYYNTIDTCTMYMYIVSIVL